MRHKFKYWMEANEHRFFIGAMWGMFLGLTMYSLAVILMEAQ